MLVLVRTEREKEAQRRRKKSKREASQHLGQRSSSDGKESKTRAGKSFSPLPSGPAPPLEGARAARESRARQKPLEERERESQRQSLKAARALTRSLARLFLHSSACLALPCQPHGALLRLRRRLRKALVPSFLVFAGLARSLAWLSLSLSLASLRPSGMASPGELEPAPSRVPATKVELTVSCRNLLDLDTFSKSDPIVILYIQGTADKEWREFGRTEVIDNTLNPDFVRKFVLDYYFEEKQNLRFDVYNVDSKTCNLPKHKDFLGQVYVALGEVIGSQRGRLERPLAGVPGKKCGSILLSAEELSNCRDIVTMQLCANKLDKKDFFGKSDPFLVFYRSNEDGTFTICHKTEVVKNNLNPVWQPFSIPVRALCNGDYDRTVKIDVYDWDRDGSHDFIGEFATSYRELSRAQSQFTVYEVSNPRKKCKKKKYINSGTVTLLSFQVQSEYTFVDYIRGGTQLNFTVAIDFTASNGIPSQPTSLHYMSPYQLSSYAMALKAVGEIIQDYDSDKLFPAYGFGAKVPPDGKVSHQFPLASSLPMSIIIVGVGPAEFGAMEELDGDEVRVSSRGRYAERDIVQFVPFRDYVDHSGNHVLSMARLAKDVLAEIPEQLLSYMKTRDIKPLSASQQQ
nr:PREDICTED: copine-9 isoform X2 [Anolis carolinensis]|eukprot:XP_008103759.2 PREDICTED: copine-9 isoform X2 [Anolis carolinensis]